MIPVLLVGLGGALGAVARYAVGVAIWRRFPTVNFPFATLFINLSGCLMIAVFLSATASRATVSDAWRYVFPIGFVGAYTTFSTYEWELFKLSGEGRWGAAALYFAASNGLGFGAVMLGSALGRRG